MPSKLSAEQKKFQTLWLWMIARGCGSPSALMECARLALLKACKGPRFDEGAVYDFGQRIAKYDGTAATVPGFVPFVSEAKGEWYVTNDDLSFWADLCRYGDRDLTPNWSNMVGSITETLHRKRRWQAWLSFSKGGGVTEEHRKLLGALRWNVAMGRGDGVCLYVDGKHPMGDSAREQRMAEVLGWPLDWLKTESDVPADIREKVWTLFDELPFALNAVFSPTPTANKN